jgi:hypothetical protein
MTENPLGNEFYKNHYNLMKKAKVFKWKRLGKLLTFM